MKPLVLPSLLVHLPRVAISSLLGRSRVPFQFYSTVPKNAASMLISVPFLGPIQKLKWLAVQEHSDLWSNWKWEDLLGSDHGEDAWGAFCEGQVWSRAFCWSVCFFGPHLASCQADATKFSETGIVGEDAEDVVRQLADAAGGSSAVAGYGIVHLDLAMAMAFLGVSEEMEMVTWMNRKVQLY